MRRSPALRAGVTGVLLMGALALPASASVSVAAASDGGGAQSFTIKDPRIAESSGLAASHLHPGVYWTHNDSGDGPYIYAVDSRTGKTVATVTLSGIGTPRDVEAISIGPGNQIYVGDIGDNLGGTWPYVWIYRLPEPKVLKDQTVRATQYVVKYSDGPRNAESLIVHPKTGRVYIIDKNENGGHLFEGPSRLSTSGTNIFRPVATVDLWATDAALSPDGRRLAVRGYFGGIYYDWNGGRIRRGGRLDVPLQQQGESVTYSLDGTRLLYGSEGKDSPVQAQDAPRGASSSSADSPPAHGSPASGSGPVGSIGGGVKAGAVAVALGALVLLGLGRLRRSRRSRRES
ncbi:WD40 repeat domain-containing protein [Streptomyces sp. NPDC006739]|uniref:WD40 repeat domain-containing protein n=1 Tax=Streptomyces sp. NPDC006739 TaxID=3364763 RepID=UPI003693736E